MIPRWYPEPSELGFGRPRVDQVKHGEDGEDRSVADRRLVLHPGKPILHGIRFRRAISPASNVRIGSGHDDAACEDQKHRLVGDLHREDREHCQVHARGSQQERKRKLFGAAQDGAQSRDEERAGGVTSRNRQGGAQQSSQSLWLHCSTLDKCIGRRLKR